MEDPTDVKSRLILNFTSRFTGRNKHWNEHCTFTTGKQCFTSPPTQYRLYVRRFLQIKRPNQQYQSTEGESCKRERKQRKQL